ncbi:hypothetical protein [Brevibacillus sp. MER 51]|uniref:hypothetical protein n=1 Tax=Brevibacillus sp. MER 51 TaxID=2939560 RepID=UPI00203D29E5|nr:hypothetical protein [Brevibacillus sp. MER 51]MCM3144992.1 hypothetical protein [Brevibacillus sp. MER 51]
MKTFLRFAMAIVLLFTLSGNAFASQPIDPKGYVTKFTSLKESYSIGERVKLTVNTQTGGELTNVVFKVASVGGDSINNAITSVQTTYRKSNATYTTTGNLTLSSEGVYFVQFQAKLKLKDGEITIKETATIEILNPNKITMTVTPGSVHVKKGTEVPILINYSSKYTPKFTYNTKVTELSTTRTSNGNKKVILFSADQAGEYMLTIEAKNKYDAVSDTVKIIVE